MADNNDTTSTHPDATDHHIRQLARVVLLVFLLTFMLSRVLVFLIMDHQIPDLYMHMGGTHVHHLNYGIFLLVGVGAWMLFQPPQGHQRTVCAALYAIGLGLTFDEFGMWLHLGGGYWQRASFDAITVIAAVLALIAYAPAQGSWTRKHYLATTLLVIAMAAFVTLFAHSREAHELGSRLHLLEEGGPQ